MLKKILFFLLLTSFCYSQDFRLSALSISKELTENANSVVRDQKLEIDISSLNQMQIKKKKIISVLNSKGLNNVDAVEYYDKSTKVKLIEATIYNSYGEEIKKIKRKDFQDRSVVDGFSVLTDGRILYLDYTPIAYPFTIVYESIVESNNTAFIPSWYPLDDYYESIEKSSIKIEYIKTLGFKFKENNFIGDIIKKEEKENSITYTAENIFAEKPEEYSPIIEKKFPIVLFGLDKFNLEGFEGSAVSWEEFGKLWYKNLVSDSEEISLETKAKINELVNNETDVLKKARIIYEFVQNRTRYVSVQLGIGGWKPMKPIDVDKLGYGDCKALSNYTRVLLKNVGIESYYTVIYGDSKKKDFDQDFVSKQGNHVILTIPYQDKNIFLECTNQNVPFGYGGTFTDDRFALLIKPQGGQIIKTSSYSELDNLQQIHAKMSFDTNGNLEGNIKIVSKGIQYDDVYNIQNSSKQDIENYYYQSKFPWINNMKIESFTFNNDKDKIEFTENLKVKIEKSLVKTNNVNLFSFNIFNKLTSIPQRYKNRKYPLEIKRGYSDEDIVEIEIPSTFKIESIPDDVIIENKFGKYQMECRVKNNVFIYKRVVTIKQGVYEKSEYENYRQFIEQIVKNDNAKLTIKE